MSENFDPVVKPARAALPDDGSPAPNGSSQVGTALGSAPQVGQPITPTPAYEGQLMPPAYLYGPPLGIVPGQRQQPQAQAPEFTANAAFQYAPPLGYTPPAGCPPPPPIGAPLGVPPGGAPPGGMPAGAMGAGPPSVAPMAHGSRAGGGGPVSAAEWAGQGGPGGAPGFSSGAAPAPGVEQTLRLTDGSRKHTRLSSREVPHNAYSITHADYSRNYIVKCDGLDDLPNLLRLTVRENEIKTLKGIRDLRYLRWVDASSNRLTDFDDCEASMQLEWLDAHRNDITTLRGINFAPQLTFLNLHNNRLKSLNGIEALQRLRYIDVSDNDLASTQPLQNCFALVEVNVAANRITDVEGVQALAALPQLVRLNIFYNDLDDDEERATVDYFRSRAPRVQVITTEAASRAVGMNTMYHKRKDDKKRGGCVCS